MKTVVVLNSDRAEPMVCLSTRDDLRVVPIVARKYAPLYGEGALRAQLVDDLQDSSQARVALARVLRDGPVDAIISVTEKGMGTAASLRTQFAIPGLSADQGQWFGNKLAMKARLAAQGVPVAAWAGFSGSADIARVAQIVGWPLVIKPGVGSGCSDTHVIHSPSHLQELVFKGSLNSYDESCGPQIAEAFLAVDREYHCDAVVRGGKILACVVSRYFTPLLLVRDQFDGALHLDAKSPLACACTAMLGQIINAFGLRDGVVHLEVLEANAKLHVGEIACRPGGGGIPFAMQHHFGLDLWREFIAAELEEPSALALPLEPGSRGVLGYCGLPAVAGKVVLIEGLPQLCALQEVGALSMFYEVGDEIPGRSTSASHFAGVLAFCLNDESQLPDFLARVAQIFHIETISS